MTLFEQTHRSSAGSDVWPNLPIEAWQETCSTLHLWTQVIGKIRLALAPMVNHWWQVPLYVTARGLTTSPMPYGARVFQIDFDFLAHELRIQTADGPLRTLTLQPKSVAVFYRETMEALRSLGIEISIWTTPCEIPDPIPFEKDEKHAAYDAEYAQRFWRVLVQADRVFTAFRSRFTGKVSPVHFFWGGPDLAVTRFSGRRAPEHGSVPNIPDRVVREAYSHEVSSCGFWPGIAGVSGPVFYAYAYPEPPGFKDYPVSPEAAFYSTPMGEFLLPYDAVRTAPNPDDLLLGFLQSTYVAAADRGHWDRAALEGAYGEDVN